MQIHALDPPDSLPGTAGNGEWLRDGRSPESGDRAASPGRRLVASVKWFVPARGFGFLVPDDGSPAVFCHVSAVERAGYGTLPQGARVTCEVVEGRKGPVVSSIMDIDTSTASPARAWGEERRRGAGDGGLGADDGGAVEECRGFVKFYDAVKGYGFVVPDGGGPDVFLHGRVLDRAGLDVLEPGQRVGVMVVQGARGPQATDIALI